MIDFENASGGGGNQGPARSQFCHVQVFSDSPHAVLCFRIHTTQDSTEVHPRSIAAMEQNLYGLAQALGFLLPFLLLLVLLELLALFLQFLDSSLPLQLLLSFNLHVCTTT